MRRLRQLLAYSLTLQDIAEDLCCHSDEIRATAAALRHESRRVLAILVQRRARALK